MTDPGTGWSNATIPYTHCRKLVLRTFESLKTKRFSYKLMQTMSFKQKKPRYLFYF
jgi:hypothetical protein